MTPATLLFLPPNEATPWRWWRVEGDGVAREGEGLPEADGAAILAVPPADAVTLHWAELPARSPAQAVAAARIVVAEATAAGAGGLHVAVGPDTGGERAIAVVDGDRMAAWLAMLARLGIDPAAIVPAPLLLPAPEDGYVRGAVGGQEVVRGRSSAFADEAPLTALVTAGVAPLALAGGEIRAAAAVAAGAVPLDLRQGTFARRRRRSIDWSLVRRLAILGGLVLLATLAIDLVRIARYAAAAGAAETRTEAIARQGIARDAGAGDSARMLGERLSRLRGPGLGFSRSVAAVYGVVQEVPDAEVTGLAFQPEGALRVSLALPGEGQANSIKARLERIGFRVEASVFQAAGGRVTGDLTVRS